MGLPVIQPIGNDGVNPASAANPIAAQISLSNAVLSATNAIPVTTAGRLTYGCAIDYFTPAATPTDIVEIIGSASKTIRVLRVTMSSTQTTAGINKWYLIKRSAASTTGTVVAQTAVPLDSANAAATGLINKVTANRGALGTAVGTLKTISVLSPAPASVSFADTVLHDELYNGQGVVLRGVAESLCLNFAGAAVPTGLSLAVNILWTEE